MGIAAMGASLFGPAAFAVADAVSPEHSCWYSGDAFWNSQRVDFQRLGSGGGGHLQPLCSNDHVNAGFIAKT